MNSSYIKSINKQRDMWIVLTGLAVIAVCIVFVGYLAFAVMEFILPDLFELAVSLLEAVWYGLVFIFRKIISYF
jgi:hypothetical protein